MTFKMSSPMVPKVARLYQSDISRN